MYDYENQNQSGSYGSNRYVSPEYRTGGYGYGASVGGAGAPGGGQRKEKKRGGFLGRAFKACVLGLSFGAFGAAGFYGVKTAGEQLGLIATGQAQAAVLSENRAAELAAQQTRQDDTVLTLPTTNVSTAVVTDVTQVVEDVMPAIVSIVNEGSYSYFYYTVPSESSGSGIIIGESDDELLIVSNYHVVSDADTLTVTFVDGSEARAMVKGTDSSMDLAVIAVSTEDLDGETLDAIQVAVMGDSDALQVGEPAIAIGNALGYGQSVTTGVISALNRELDMENTSGTFIQTDAAINPGNSGGALLNISGEVIGINSNKIGGSTVEGMGYAIPISAARPIIESLMQRTTRTLVDEAHRGYLGITGATVTSQEAYYYGYPEGVYVSNVNDGSAADLAGIRKGDYIVSFDGESISSMEQLQRLLTYYAEGTTVEVGVKRPAGDVYKDVTLTITLGDKSVLGRTN